MAILHEAVKQAKRRLLEAYERQSPVWGLPTGFTSLDNLTGGLHPGEVTIIGARPSVGKSSLISQITFNASIALYEESLALGEAAGQIIYFSPEMSPEDLIRRQASQITNVPLTRIRNGDLTVEELELVQDAMETVLDLGQVLKMEAGEAVIIGDLVNTVTIANRSGPKVRLVAVDYLTRIDAGLGGGSEYSAANLISRRLKDMALSQESPVIVGAQLSRKGDRRGNDDDDPTANYPRLTDLRDSGRIEEDADAVWLLHRDNELRALTGHNGVDAAALIVAKNRNGPVGIVQLMFRPDVTSFTE